MAAITTGQSQSDLIASMSNAYNARTNEIRTVAYDTQALASKQGKQGTTLPGMQRRI